MEKAEEKATQQLISLLRADAFDEAKTLSQRLLLDICAQSRDNNEIRSRAERLLSSIAEALMEMKYLKFELPMSALPIYQSASSGEEDSAALAQASLERLMDEASNAFRLRMNPHIVSAQSYIRAHYQEPDLSQDEVSASIGISSGYLSKLFRSSLSVSFVDYLNDIRISESLALLTGTELSVGEIASAAGFNSTQNYIRVFRKHTGMTPGQYRTSV